MSLFPKRLSRRRVLLAEAGAALAVAVLVAGCGNEYRPTVTPIYSNGPAGQVTSYAVVVSSPSANSAGVATIIDYSGDAVMAEAPTIGIGPLAFTIDEYGATGYTYNSDHTITNFPIKTTLQEKLETATTLPTGAEPINIDAPTSGLWIGDVSNDSTDVFTGAPQTFKLSIPIATITNSTANSPMFVAGASTSVGQRQYVISQNIPSSYTGEPGVACNLNPRSASLTTGTATPVETSNYTLDNPIPVGQCPVFAVQSPDMRRLFVLNRGDDTITVINSQSNALDQCAPFQNQNGQWVTCHPTIHLPSGSGPVYAEYNQATQQLVVANYDGGSISVINVALDQYGNDSNTYANSNCIATGNSTSTYAGCGAIVGGFGTINTIPVGAYPASVTVLWDGSRAYTANQGDCGGTCTSSSNGTVTIVNLSDYTVEKTLPVTGLPRTVVSTENSLYGKVYVAAPNTNELTILQTETDLIDTTVSVEGNVVDVRATTQDGAAQTVSTYNGSTSISNINYSSRVPGWGQPCNLPPSVMNNLYPSGYTLAECQQIP